MPFSVLSLPHLAVMNSLRKVIQKILNDKEKTNWFNIEKRFDRIFQWQKNVKILVDAEEFEVQMQ